MDIIPNLVRNGIRAVHKALHLARRKPRPAQAITRSCVIIGPVASGKTALLYSLSRCTSAESHSYARSFRVTVNSDDISISDDAKQERQADPSDTGNDVSLRWYDDRLPGELEEGLAFEATDMSEFRRPKFVITARALERVSGYAPGMAVEATFTTFDGSGGLLLEPRDVVLRQNPDPNFKGRYDAARKQLEQDLMTAESFVICLPIDGRITDRERERIKDYIRLFSREDKIQARHLLICFTKYEMMGRDLGRNAYTTLANRHQAGRIMLKAFRDRMPGIHRQLQEFRDSGAKRLVTCAPVSTYGFIPGHGGPNLDPETGKRMRIIPFREVDGWSEARPYPREAAMDLWRPFLTLDPFVYLATGYRDKHHCLVHDLTELEP